LNRSNARKARYQTASVADTFETADCRVAADGAADTDDAGAADYPRAADAEAADGAARNADVEVVGAPSHLAIAPLALRDMLGLRKAVCGQGRVIGDCGADAAPLVLAYAQQQEMPASEQCLTL
jgi:hypothetical protein